MEKRLSELINKLSEFKEDYAVSEVKIVLKNKYGETLTVEYNEKKQ